MPLSSLSQAKITGFYGRSTSELEPTQADIGFLWISPISGDPNANNGEQELRGYRLVNDEEVD